MLFSLDQFGLIGTQCILNGLQYRPDLGTLGVCLDQVDPNGPTRRRA